MEEPHANLVAHETVVHLPEDPALEEIRNGGKEHFLEVVKRHPDSSLCWALLAEGCLRNEALGMIVAGYAYARTGYHRGLDALRQNGWRGGGAIPWEHEPNRGFLRALWALGVAANLLGETDEAERCLQLLRDSSETGYQILTEAPPQESQPEDSAKETPAADDASPSEEDSPAEAAAAPEADLPAEEED